MKTKISFHQTQDNDIIYHHADFKIGSVVYMIIFSDDNDSLFYWLDNPDISPLIQGRKTFSIKFAVKDYIECGNDDLYAPADNHQFGKAEIRQLKQQLEILVSAHYQQYQPDCYIFVAERSSLVRMYKKMCSQPSEFMVNFQPITDLGDEKDCFILKTPHYKEA
ncbi:helicase [Testudinibacter sp. TR-2022]|uniref:helicase n=1 Tax=Testudinibacter sp. TR-2022 TaxID=2585029 RepID=UPI00111810BE|nr:helicase [Testudinibacter sp. TR-2022]TNH06509.1 helicase [Pasteurellaceae bacterium Phil11]TNH25502.1 helicase [Testudinibacter sp. TR-2022]TNH28080.1 helicase [Testudinibacter sp. TR-2022]